MQYAFATNKAFEAGQIHDQFASFTTGVNVSLPTVELTTSRDLTAQEQASVQAWLDNTTPNANYRRDKALAYLSQIEAQIDAITNLAGAKTYLKKLVRFLINSEAL